MVSSSISNVNIQLPLTQIFKGNHNYWCIKIKTLFHSQGIWNLVESGYQTRDRCYFCDNQEEQLKVT